MNRSLREIGLTHKTDKIRHHGYHRFYPIYLEHLRDKKFAMLEIGIYKGESLKMWKEYFPKASIYGIDIKDGYKHDRGEVFKGNQADSKFLNKIVKEIGKKVSFIIDDGSHKPEHQISTFNFLFPNLLKQGGIYIIEDIETSYWKKGVCHGYQIECGYKHSNNVVNIFKEVVDSLNQEFIRKHEFRVPKHISQNVVKQIGLVSFQHNSVIIIKKDKGFIRFENRKYRFKEYL